MPLGYDLRDRRLVVNKAEAETVRLIFRLYLELKTVRRVRDELDRRSIVSKQWVSKGRCTARRIPVRTRRALSPAGQPDLRGRDPAQEESPIRVSTNR